MKRSVLFMGITCVFFVLMLSVATSPVDAKGKPPTATPNPTNTPAPTDTPAPTPTPGGNPHSGITQYDGPQTCVACHESEAQDMLNSEHMQWDGKWQEVNTYCTAPEPADFACRSCHAGTGKVTNLTVNDVDCLVCHNDTYKRALGPQSNPVTVTDWLGNSKTYNFPIQTNGDYTFLPRYDLMPPGTTMLSLAQNVHLPTKQTCLNCHAKAGGGDGTKRGDIYMNLASPSLSVTDDVHMSPSGANLTCQDCHVSNNHQIPGTGIDLRVSEGGTVTCTQCHPAKPHASDDVNKHVDRVACQTCHIPAFGKNTSTEMARNWTNPHWNPGGCNGQGAWVGEEIRASNVVPEYTFWNGQSDTYDHGETIVAEADGSYAMAKALGDITDGKLFPIKVHTSYQPRHTASMQIVQYDVLWNFMTGKYEESAQRGVSFMGLNGSYEWVNSYAEQLITHGVEPKENALQCTACHSNGSQMNLVDLGYTLKDDASVVCSQCHRERRTKGYVQQHSGHVTNRQYDCSWCHAFSRPEKGLILP